MTYTNSALISYKKLSPNHSGQRNHIIDTVTIHCMAGNMSVEACGLMFCNSANQVSSNYGIGSDGRIALYVEEKNRSWCSSNAANDHRAVTIEVANDGGENTGWHVSDKAYNALIELCTDICKRNNIKELKWRGDKSLIGQADKQNMTVHRWFANKSCPGDYLYDLHSDIAEKVNKKLMGSVSAKVVNSNAIYRSLGIAAKRDKPSTNGTLKARCIKSQYYLANEVVTPAEGNQKWFRHTETGLYSALTDTDGSKLFEYVGTYKAVKTNDYVKVRTGAGITYKVLTTLSKGAILYTTGKEINSGGICWAQVIYGNMLCYCDKQWLTI